MAKREFDLVVYGATGFTGRLIAEYLAKHYGNDDVKWAMAGRSDAKLAQVRDLIHAPADTPLIIADSSDPSSLKALAERTKVVITTVGPYQLYGVPMLEACIAAGTDYVDLCGEPAWMHDTVLEYHDAAKASGARIVHSCGFDSIPFDLGVYFLQQHAIKTTGAPIARVKGRMRKMRGETSGGTAASFMETMARVQREPEVMNWLKDPFSLCPDFDGPKQPHGAKPIYDEDLGTWAAPFIMASINTKNVHRSNALLGHQYGADFVYDEMVQTGPGEAGEAAANAVASSGGMDKNPPKPGEGPSQESRDAGFYDAMFTGLSVENTRITAGVTGDKDPGYGSTSKMIAEAAICLARDVSHDDVAGGVLTPAPAMGQALIDRLVANAGLTFTIET
ncbi:MAG: saccharopine dehydrogenase [Robiginitomaculum sp.]|nr:MAG: saccharopine dehydrogenase [Robiginitomaculum sp.]